MSEISPETLSNRLQTTDDDVFVLDIRHPAEFEDWHILASHNIDVYEELQNDHATAREVLSDLPQDRDIVTVCGVGAVADTATDLLEELGYDAATLEDGMNGWSRVHRNAPLPVAFDDDFVQVTRPGKGCLSYVLISDGEAAVFDPSHYLEEYEAILEAYDATLVGVFDTHAHADHVSGAKALAAQHDVPYYLHPQDALALDATPIEDGATIAVGHLEVEVVHTPGHSEGSVSFAIEDAALLTGDTLFHESVGRVELGVEAGIEDSDVEQNAATLYDSLQRLLAWPENTLVLPAHDPGSPEPPVMATLADVTDQNSDLVRERDAFIAALASDIPDHPPNFERVKRTNVGQEVIPAEELAELELGPNNCAAE